MCSATPQSILAISQTLQMKEGDLKILKVEYLSNHLYDHTQVLSLDLGDQSKVFKYFK
jgi:hypothetical protein